MNDGSVDKPFEEPGWVAGEWAGAGMRFAVVTARFNSEITMALTEGALAGFERCGVARDQVTLVSVPGAYEISTAARGLSQQGFDAVVAIGAVIRGDTAHFEYVAGPAAYGISQASTQTGVPIIFGVLTTENLAQAHERSQPDHTNKGYEAATAAVEMANLMRKIRSL